MPINFKPGQVIRWRAGQGFWLDDAPFFVTGVNYVASYICTNYWEDWRPAELTRDLDRIAGLGLNAVRIPVHWEFAEPAPGRFRPDMMERFGQFLTWAEERGLAVMPWFLVGVATQSYDVSWRNGQSYFTEPMVSHAANHIRTFVERFKDRPNILCWDLCDEPEFYAQMPGTEQLPYDRERFATWVKRLYAAAKETDPAHAVMMGFGHLVTNDYGMPVGEMEGLLDMMGVTAYSHDGDMEQLHSYRNTSFLPWYLRMNDTQGRGAFASEAPGWSTVIVGDRSMGLHYRLVLHSLLGAGSWGFLPWVWNDFVPEIWEQEPLNTAIFEPGFGLCRVDGSLKKAGEEYGKFAAFVRDYPPHEWTLTGPEAWILLPEDFYKNTEASWRTAFVAYIAARQAGLRVRFIWEKNWTAEAARECRLLILPGGPVGLRIKTWMSVERWVGAGGTLYCSQGYQRLIYPRFGELFGVEVEGPATAGGGVTWRKTDEASEVIARAGELPAMRSRVLVNVKEAEVWLEQGNGEPLLTHHRFGQGQTLLLTFSAEQSLMSMESEQFAAHPLHTLYRAAAGLAGLATPVQSSDPRLEVTVRERGAQWLVTVINHAMQAVEAELDCAAPLAAETIVRADGGELEAVTPRKMRVRIDASEVLIFTAKPQ